MDLEFICDVCGQPVDDDCGSLYVRFAEVNKHRTAMADWKAASEPGEPLNIVTILQLPSPARWRIDHDACRRNEADSYHIAVEQVRTWRDLVRWTAHLMGKNWLADTNWRILLANAADARDRRIAAVARHGDAA